MGNAKFRVSHDLIRDALKMPAGNPIYMIRPIDDHTCMVYVNGADFPEIGADGVVEVEPIIHQVQWDWRLEIQDDDVSNREG